MADLAAKKARPQYRNIDVPQILSYRLPPAGIVSILHRISGALLFLVGIPFSLYLLQQSITSEISFQTYRSVVGSIPGKLVSLVLIWAFVHHAIAGIRYLLLDRHVGIQKEASRTSANAVLVVTVLLTLVLALKLFGVF
jgi:succinate dehydrogenase / fumarate reductase cytochrome b subunit